jgi:Tfp pilus assembly protein PilE
VTTLHRLLITVLVAAALSSCSLWPKITGREKRSEEQAQRLAEVQQTCQRYADGYAGQVLETIGPMKRQASDPAVYYRLLSWQITQLNSAYTIATGPNPIVCELDFVVLATLSRMVAEDTLVALDGDLTSPLPRVYRDLEQEAWTNVAAVLTPPEMDELRGIIAAWRAKNPEVMLVGFVHFSEFAKAAGSAPAAQSAPGGLFGLIGIDPLAGLDPAVKQIEQTRLLAERVIFYMQRVPYLMDLQAERVIAQATLAPEVARANASLERASLAMSDYAKIGASLPDALARERDALIRQLSGEMLRQQDELRGLLVDLQTTLAAGSEAAAAVDSAVKSLDRLAARFPPREPGTESAAGRPFDITEYTAAAAEFTGTARQLTELLDTLGREGQPVVAAVAGGVESARGVVDYLFWRALLLGLLLIAAGLAAVLAYRVLAPRLGRPRLDN